MRGWRNFPAALEWLELEAGGADGAAPPEIVQPGATSRAGVDPELLEELLEERLVDVLLDGCSEVKRCRR